ncbi:nucleoside recognition domain-containing protein [Telmatospirillum siberiense]|uniref:Spore maturation protein n=1 Tax=Telmatospirillum siberiense TaxID=382514 RepID=A0A2N3PQ48_9PROT|nr:nucleoside recognition domain-containing protein [Telmatospirillum siberiense]PKU22522.1 spore maturation protein [Telmatospirillum siberiense]
MNIVFFVLIAAAFGVAGWRQVTQSPTAAGVPMEALGQAALKSAEGAVTLGLGLIGTMALFLGIMRIAEAGGLMRVLARLLRPLLHRLFPEIPPDHPAMGAMVMNVAANVLGLSNAATPFGVRAMQALDRLNPRKGVATDAMVLFLALNTANVTLLPTHVMALRTAIGSHDPAAVIPTTLFATLWSTGFAILFAKWGARWFPADGAVSSERTDEMADEPVPEEVPPAYPLWVSVLAGVVCLLVIPVTVIWGRVVSPWIIPSMLVGVLGYGLIRRVAVYEAFVEGAKDGLAVSLRILPYLVAILVAVGMFRDSGAMELLIVPLGRLTGALGLPPEALSMAVLRSLSGSASFGYLAALLKDPAIGPDGYLGMLVSTIYGSSETTFYVLAVYFGAAGVKRIRHALLAGLLADLGGTVFSVLICGWLYG